MNKKYTHISHVIGYYARASKLRILYELRETKMYWIDPHGGKFRKSDGRPPGDWSLCRLELETIKEMK